MNGYLKIASACEEDKEFIRKLIEEMNFTVVMRDGFSTGGFIFDGFRKNQRFAV